MVLCHKCISGRNIELSFRLSVIHVYEVKIFGKARHHKFISGTQQKKITPAKRVMYGTLSIRSFYATNTSARYIL